MSLFSSSLWYIAPVRAWTISNYNLNRNETMGIFHYARLSLAEHGSWKPNFELDRDKPNYFKSFAFRNIFFILIKTHVNNLSHRIFRSRQLTSH